MKIVELHGFNVKDKGVGSIGRLRKPLLKAFPDAQYDADNADYGRDLLLRANYLYWIGDTIDRITNTLKDADLVICHSNGANYCMKALRKYCNKDIKIVFMSPALNRSHAFNESFKECLVMHSEDDRVVSLAKYIPFSSWGDMGKVGAYTDDYRVKNMSHKGIIKHHSDWFIDKHIASVANTIVAFYKGEL